MTAGPAENTASKQAGRGPGKPFRKGYSGNPDGKPRGARNHATMAAEQLLEGEAEGLTRRAVELAMGGDSTALRLCLDRIYPVRKGRPLVLSLPSTDTAADVAKAVSAVIEQMAVGDVTPDEAATVVGVIETKRKAIETEELDRRLREVEGKLGERK